MSLERRRGMEDTQPVAIAEAVRRACLEAALAAYESAGFSGLCGEGRWECAIEAIRGLDLREVTRGLSRTENLSRRG
jgi:hypothetical protein